jgi:hypothetical protein
MHIYNLLSALRVFQTAQFAHGEKIWFALQFWSRIDATRSDVVKYATVSVHKSAAKSKPFALKAKNPK